MSGLDLEPPFAVLNGDRSPLLQYGKNTFRQEDTSQEGEKVRKEVFSLDEDDFISTLDAKLRNLEEEGKRRKAKKRSVSLDSRPMFITTVKTGIFLEPPPELAVLLGYSRTGNVSSSSTTSQKSGEELMYSFSSQPRVLNNNNKPKAKVSNERQQQVNMEKQKAKNNRTKRDTNHNNNLNNSTVNNKPK